MNPPPYYTAYITTNTLMSWYVYMTTSKDVPVGSIEHNFHQKVFYTLDTNKRYVDTFLSFDEALQSFAK